jgi:hypothetical protein
VASRRMAHGPGEDPAYRQTIFVHVLVVGESGHADLIFGPELVEH